MGESVRSEAHLIALGYFSQNRDGYWTLSSDKLSCKSAEGIAVHAEPKQSQTSNHKQCLLCTNWRSGSVSVPRYGGQGARFALG